MDTELSHIPALQHVGIALAQYTEGLYPDGEFVPKSRRWVYDPNFVTFTIQKRDESIVLTLRGQPEEYEQSSQLLLQKDQNGYSRCKITEPVQLAAAAQYIERAFVLWDRGRTRPKTRPLTDEVPI